jgi:nucleotide-binding universal stress UspA family protein
MDLRSVREGPILVACDGDRTSLPALEAAHELSKRTRAPVRVIAIVEANPMFMYEYGAIAALPELIAGAREQLLISVKELVMEVAGSGAEWAIDVRDGWAPSEIVRAAGDARARLLVLGVRHRGIGDRLFARETSRSILRNSRTPVLVVPEGYGSAPTRMLVATDFSPASVFAARTALELFNTVTHVSLVYVAATTAYVPPQFATWLPTMSDDIDLGLERTKSELAVPPGITIDCVRLEGKPTTEIAEYSRSHDIDLIVTGNRGAGFLDRMLMGSTSSGLVHRVPCAVLVVRTPANLDVPWALLERNQVIPPDRWAAELQAFTERNLGRKTSIEVDDPELGAQAQESDYPLLGVAYDHHYQHVEIMVGDRMGTARHLTRGIGNVTSIDLLKDARGHDWILRVRHGAGQTILTLNRVQEGFANEERKE